MTNKALRTVTTLVLAGSLLGCGEHGLFHGSETVATDADSGNTQHRKTFHVKGVFVNLKEDGTAVIDHEEIPNYMGAMVMPFRAADPEQLAGLTSGDEIEFDYIVEELSSWIENVKKTGRNHDHDPSLAVAPPPASNGAQPISIGQRLPDYEFLDQNGNTVRLADCRGSAVVLTFIFSRCPVPEFCPLTMTKLRSAGVMLETDPEAPKNWRLLAVSFDTVYDTPEVMKAFGKAHRVVDSPRWDLLSTPNPTVIGRIAHNVDLRFGKTSSGSFQHNLRTLVINTDGRVTRIFTDQTWTIDDLVQAVKAAAKTSS